MPREQDQQVTVRLLPDGEANPALLCGLNGQLLQLDLSPVSATLRFKPGDLVEVSCPKTLYLGEIRSSRPESVVIGVEHALDREALALIQQVWHGPA